MYTMYLILNLFIPFKEQEVPQGEIRTRVITVNCKSDHFFENIDVTKMKFERVISELLKCTYIY